MTPKQKAQLEAVDRFLESTTIPRLNKNIRNLVFEHLAAQKDGYTFDLTDLLGDLLNLFDLLEAIE